MFNNFNLGYCFWDLPVVILLVAVVVTLIIQQRNHKMRMDELKQQYISDEANKE